MQRLVDGYFQFLKIAIVTCLALMVILVFGNVVLRYAFNLGITMSEELSRFLFVWLTFLGAIIAFREHGHLGVDMVVSRLSGRRQEGLPDREPGADAVRHLAVPAGQLGTDHHQSRREVSFGRHVDGHVLRRRRHLQHLRRRDPAPRLLSAASPAGCPRRRWCRSRNRRSGGSRGAAARAGGASHTAARHARTRAGRKQP